MGTWISMILLFFTGYCIIISLFSDVSLYILLIRLVTKRLLRTASMFKFVSFVESEWLEPSRLTGP